MTKPSTSIKKVLNTNSAIDLLKFISSIFVAALHSGLDLGFLNPLYRLAVPFFFLSSSYFLFSKISGKSTETERRTVLFQFVLRNVKLYAFWFLLWLPYLMTSRTDWFESHFLINVLKFLRSLLWGSTFTASWYIVATVIDCSLVYFLSQKFSTKKLFVFGFLTYMVCLAYSNYYGITRCIPYQGYLFTAFITVFNSVVNGFPAGIFWVIAGKFFAENQFKTKLHHYVILILGFCLLLVENQIVLKMDWVLVNDCFIMLIPVCCALFQIARNAKWSWEPSVRYRNMSTIIYASHGGILGTLTAFAIAHLNEPVQNIGLVKFLITSVACILLSTLLFQLQKRKRFSWVRYSH